MGLYVHVYRHTYDGKYIDCTMGGISSKYEQLCLVNVDGPFDPSDTRPAAMLVEGNLKGTLKIVPAYRVEGPGQKPRYEPDKRWLMFGGNYAATSDSRLGYAIRKLLGAEFEYAVGAIPIHDRFEG